MPKEHRHNTPVQSDNALLRLLHQRLFSLAGISAEGMLAQQLCDLFSALFQAQQRGNTALDCDTIAIDVSALQEAFPQLIGSPQDTAPITYFPPFIAFRRSYQQLYFISDTLKKRQVTRYPSQQALNNLDWTFKGNHRLNDAQRVAVFTAASQPFCLITGGAGTGKTTTLSKALELILLDRPNSDILLAAPTGKAAHRLNEALINQLGNSSERVRPRLSRLRAHTLHRLLAISESSGRAYRNANNPLCCQVLAIDEASMISSDLLAQVLDALPNDAALILLGDANQLPPVNATAFFNEASQLPLTYSQYFAERTQQKLGITLSSESTPSPLTNQLCRLQTSQRFAEQSLIERCATATLSGDATALIANLGKYFHPLTETQSLYESLLSGYADNRNALLEQLPKRMILCSNRQGIFGSQAINNELDKHFRHRITGKSNKTITNEWYEGRAILIEKNDNARQLSNGDIGRCQQHQGQWFIVFDGGLHLPVNDLPPDYSLAFAMTIHKSQGSEYRHVDIILGQFDVTREQTLLNTALLYTAITRSKQSLALFSDSRLLQGLIRKQPPTRSALPYL